MAINIKELFDADSDNIKVEKTNYNFDQVLANGGGPIGPKGVQGTTGNVGQKGDEGDKGDKGDGGQKGEQGVSLNIWDSDVDQSGTPFNILRPFNVAGTVPSGALTSRIILGDDTSVSTTPSYSPTALLSMLLKGDDAANHVELKIDNSNAAVYNIRSEYVNSTGTTLKIVGSAAAVQGETVNMTINPGNNITLLGSTLDLNANGVIQISSSGSNVIIEGDNGVTIDGQDGAILIDNTTGSGNIDLSSSEDLSLNASAVNITAGGGGTNTDIIITANDGEASIRALNGNDVRIGNATGTANVFLLSSTEIQSDTPTFQINATASVDINSPILDIDISNAANITTTNTNIINVSSASGYNDLQVEAASKLKIEKELITADKSIFFSDSDGDHDGNTNNSVIPSEVSSGDGIKFKAGGVATGGVANGLLDADGFYTAPNNGSSDDKRTLSDYFYEDLVTNIGGLYESVGGVTSNGEITTNGTIGVLPSSTNTSNYSYVKMGNIINVWGELYYDLSSVTDSDTWAASSDPLIILLNDTSISNRYKFPYVNSTSWYIDVNVTIAQNSSTSGQDGQLVHDFTTVGRIAPGDNIIYLHKYGLLDTTGSAKWHFVEMQPTDLYDSNAGGSFKVYYNFSMPVEWNSYNRVFATSSSASFNNNNKNFNPDGI